MNQSADAIRQQMQDIRRDLADDIDSLAESTREMADWQVYFKRYPWIVMGAAAAVGFLVVPKRVELVHPDPDALLELAKRKKLVVEASPKKKAKNSVAGTLLSLAGTIALRGAMAYAGNHFGKLSAENSTVNSTESL